jgi:hypothetical protein
MILLKPVFIIALVAVSMIGLMVPSVFAASGNSTGIFPPHIHDEIKISINSEEPIVVYVQENEIKNIEAHIGDTIDVTVSVGDDTALNSISVVKFVTNYANKPSDMNRYFTTNYDDYGQVGLSVYEWYNTKGDLTYDYSENISWNTPSVEIKTRTQLFHEYVGSLLFSEKELLLTYSMNMHKIMPQTQVGLKIADTSNMQSNFILPFTLEILHQESDIILEKVIEEPIEETIIKEDTLFSMNLNKEKYQNGDKLIILGNVQNYDVDSMKGKNITYEIKSPENKILDIGYVAPQTDGTFEFNTFTMDTLWKTDGNYIFSASLGFGSIKEIILIMYDNKEFKNLNSQIMVDEKVVTLPLVEPVVELEIPAPFVDTSKDPQYYIDRYNNESTYKEWFDENYPKYDSIYQAVGLSEYNLEKYYELISISTKKTQYTTGETIVITGKISTSDFDMPVTLQVFDGGNLVEIAQITISSNQNFSHTLLAEGKLWSNSGTYIVKATFGSDTKDTSFIFHPTSSPSAEFDDNVAIESAPTSQTIVDLDISVNDSIFDLGNLVSISINADNFSGTKSVSVDVTDPRGNTVISRSVTVSPNDSQNIDFRLSENSKSGNYKVTATTYDNGKIITEKTNFRVQSQFNSFSISGVTVTDQQGNPSSLDAGEMGFIKVDLKSNKLISTLVTVNLFDSELTSIGIGSVKTSLASGESEIILSFMIPEDAAIGPADIYVNAFSDWPSNGGIALTGELASVEDIS